MSNLLNDDLHFGFTILFKRIGKRKKEDDTFLRKKTAKQQNSATIMISIDGKKTVSLVKKITGEIVWITVLKKRTLKKF